LSSWSETRCCYWVNIPPYSYLCDSKFNHQPRLDILIGFSWFSSLSPEICQHNVSNQTSFHIFLDYSINNPFSWYCVF